MAEEIKKLQEVIDPELLRIFMATNPPNMTER